MNVAVRRRLVTVAGVVMGAIVAVRIFSGGGDTHLLHYLYDILLLSFSLAVLFRLPPARTTSGELTRLIGGVLLYFILTFARIALAVLLSSLFEGEQNSSTWLLLLRIPFAFAMAWSLVSLIRLNEAFWAQRRRRVIVAVILTLVMAWFDTPSALVILLTISVVLNVFPVNFMEQLTRWRGAWFVSLLFLSPLFGAIFAADLSMNDFSGMSVSLSSGEASSTRNLMDGSLLPILRGYFSWFWFLLPARMIVALFRGLIELRVPIRLKLAFTYLFSTLIPMLLLIALIALVLYLGIGANRAESLRDLMRQDLQELELAAQQWCEQDSLGLGPVPPGQGFGIYRVASDSTAMRWWVWHSEDAEHLEANGEQSDQDSENEDGERTLWALNRTVDSSFPLPEQLLALPQWSPGGQTASGILPAGEKGMMLAAVCNHRGSIYLAGRLIDLPYLRRYAEPLGVEAEFIGNESVVFLNPEEDESNSIQIGRSEDEEWEGGGRIRTYGDRDEDTAFVDRLLYHGVTEFQLQEEDSGEQVMLGRITVFTTLRDSFEGLFVYEGLNRITLLVIFILANLFGLALLFSSLLGFGITRSITSSVARLRQGMDQLRQGNLNTHIKLKNRDELGDLADGFNRMTRDLRRMIAEVAEKERLERELQIAREIQIQLLPKQLPSRDSLQLAASSEPALEVGGDYYDAIDLGEKGILFAVGDVSGKGVGGAMLMSNLQANLHTLSAQDLSLAELVRELNKQIFHNSTVEMFITFFVGILEPRGERLQYVNAGHDTPVMLSEEGVIPLDTGGMLLGVTPEAEYQVGEVALRGGELIACFSDGLTEAMNELDEEFGRERLVLALEDLADENSDEIVSGILRRVRDYAGAERASADDLTLLVVCYDVENTA